MIRKLAILLLFLTVSVSFAQDYTLYKVKRKATVETVAFLNDITPEQLLRANPTINPSAKLAPGTVLKIPVVAIPTPEPPTADPTVKEPAAEVQIEAAAEIQVVAASDTLICYDSSSKKIRIAALLPFEDPKLDQRMCEIYSGMLLAASDIGEEVDKEIVISAYSTVDLSGQHLDLILSDKDLIVGPVYQESFEKVAAWAKEHKIPIVSPLVSFDVVDNPYVISMAPNQQSKDAPLSDFLKQDKNVILIDHSVYHDKEQVEEFNRIAPSARKFAYSRERVTPQDFLPLIDPTMLNVFLVPTEQQGAIEDILSKITAINMPVKICDIAVVGMQSWLNMSNFTRTLLFRGNVSCVSPYYYDRQNFVMSSFFDDYINAFERIPSKFALRGYDIVAIMADAMSNSGKKTLTDMDAVEYIPLMNPYRFVRNPQTGNLCNDRWILVSFLENYSVNIR